MDTYNFYHVDELGKPYVYKVINFKKGSHNAKEMDSESCR